MISKFSDNDTSTNSDNDNSCLAKSKKRKFSELSVIFLSSFKYFFFY